MWTNIARKPYQRGFSLLEILVALSILSMALGVLYQATSGATRNVRNDERYVFGVELARSLLVEYAQVPSEGGSWEEKRMVIFFGRSVPHLLRFQ